jgi:hypothetical protein
MINKEMPNLPIIREAIGQFQSVFERARKAMSSKRKVQWLILFLGVLGICSGNSGCHTPFNTLRPIKPVAAPNEVF